MSVQTNAATSVDAAQGTSRGSAWPLNRLLVLVLLGAYGMLLADIRAEHVVVVRQHWTAWIPIYYTGLMTLLTATAAAFWGKRTRRLVFWFAAVGLVIGSLGFWLHNDGRLLTAAQTVLEAWYNKQDHDDGPPVLPPLAFCGLAMLGMLACARRFQPKEEVQRGAG